MMDRYIYGEVNRQSPEADVPIVDYQREMNNVGGAANVAMSIKNLGAKTSLLGLVGKDDLAAEIKSALNDKYIHTYLIEDQSRPTTSKTRILTSGDHLARIDRESTEDLSDTILTQSLDIFNEILSQSNIDLIVFQDYDKGFLSKAAIKAFTEILHLKAIPFMVDPKFDHFFDYRNATVFKPNLNELKKAFSLNELDLSQLKNLSRELMQKINSKINLITLGAEGLFIDNGETAIQINGHKSDKIDVCGAGDSVISAAALSWCSGQSLEQMATICNQVGFISCLELGVNPISLKKLLKTLPSLNQDIKINYV